jgi:hypothetical protein
VADKPSEQAVHSWLFTCSITSGPTLPWRKASANATSKILKFQSEWFSSTWRCSVFQQRMEKGSIKVDDAQIQHHHFVKEDMHTFVVPSFF